MSLIPQPPRGVANPGPESPVSLEQNTSPPVGWQRRLLRISIALFTLEIGLFLVFFPWTESWDVNYFQTLTPTLQNLWKQPSFRGALTGLGFVNIYIACLQAVHCFRKH